MIGFLAWDYYKCLVYNNRFRSPQKNHKQHDTAADVEMGSFTRLVCFAEEIVYTNYTCFQIILISETLARNWAKTHSLIIKWVRVQSQNYP